MLSGISLAEVDLGDRSEVADELPWQADYSDRNHWPQDSYGQNEQHGESGVDEPAESSQSLVWSALTNLRYLAVDK